MLDLTAMDLPFRVSWLCTLLWACICFHPQQGYNVAQGYYLYTDTPASNQFPSAAFLNTNGEDNTDVVEHESLVFPQRQQVYNENSEGDGSVTGLGEQTEQNQPDSGQEQDSLLLQKYENISAADQHPFGILMKNHSPKTPVEGISFPTIGDFRQFIETMKSSFLTPGSDLIGHLETAQEPVKSELTSGAQSIDGESLMFGYVKKEPVHDKSKKDVWSEPMKTVLEKSEPDANYQSESLYFFDPYDNTANLIFPNNNQPGRGSALYSHHNLAAAEHVASNYGSLVNSGPSEKKHIFSAPGVRNEDVDLMRYNVHEQKASVNPNSPSQDLGYYSNKKPLTFKTNNQQIKGSLTGLQKQSSDFKLGNDFQRGKLTEANVLSLQEPPSSNYYKKSLYVNAPRSQFYIPDNLSKHRGQDAQTVHIHQPGAGKGSKEINSTPTIQLTAATASVSLNSDPSSQRSGGKTGVGISNRPDSQHQVFNRKQPVRSYSEFTPKPPSPLHDSSRYDGSGRHLRVSVSRPTILTAPAKPEKSVLSKENLVSVIQEPEQIPIPNSLGLTSTESRLSPQVSDIYTTFNSKIKFPLMSEPKKTFPTLSGNDFVSRNFGIKNIFSDRVQPDTTSLKRLFSTQQKPSFLHNFKNLFKVQKHPPREPSNMVYRPLKPLSTSKVSGPALSGGLWRNGNNTVKLSSQKDSYMSPPFVNTYVRQSRNSYARGKVSLSKTQYLPNQAKVVES